LKEVALVITGTGGVVTEMVRVAEPIPVALVAPIVTTAEPAAVGDPLISPVPVFRESPEGRPVALKLVGLLPAVIW
jgi:hypothetical protein